MGPQFYYLTMKQLVMLTSANWNLVQVVQAENESCSYQARIQEFTLGGAPWIGEGSDDRQGPQRVQGSARWGALGGEAPWEAHGNSEKVYKVINNAGVR